ncbi:DUF4097 domain-containing protein [Halobacillus litoralis]|uniref:DUF4097 family beta strand repeat-containing protein n=1 Tax=Halobacillus litoralis TaxID=45668 RepID=UPI001CD6387A|nr:DUF4097 family beta strand repeat-containing protein [Halobacillus litoralis]MCA0972295.1 DUF4097 domain-containing protein [Halobacillus litoralis]
MKMLSTIALSLITLGVIVFFTVSPRNVFSFDTKPIHLKEKVGSQNIEEVTISSSFADIEVLPSEKEEIEIEVKGEVNPKNDQLNVDVKGKELRVQFPVNQQVFTFSLGGSNQATLTVSLPRKQYEQVDVDSSSGRIDIKDLSAVHLRAESSSGDQTITDSDIKKRVELGSSSGRIYTENITTREISLEASSGEIENRSLRAESSEAHTSSGNVAFFNHKADTDLYVHTSSGDTTIEFDGKPTSTRILYSSSSGEASLQYEGFRFNKISDSNLDGQIGDGDALIEVESSSGDLHVRKGE